MLLRYNHYCGFYRSLAHKVHITAEWAITNSRQQKNKDDPCICFFKIFVMQFA